MIPSAEDLWLSLELFRDPLLCAAIAGLALGHLGVWVVLRRAVFLTAAVTQAAGLGVALAFYGAIHLGITVPPLAGAIGAAAAAAALLGAPVERVGLTRERVLGLAFLATSAGALAVGSRITQEAQDISAILFGTAVLVRPQDLLAVAATAAAVLALALVGRRALVAAGFDPDGARVAGLPVGAIDALLWIALAVLVAVCTRALGALPVFAFSVLPATAALAVTRHLGQALWVAPLVGAFAGVLGYVLAFFGELPVGPSQTLVAVAAVALATALRPLIGRFVELP